ncbi:MAG: SoxR reducing system RseC family protein [Pseudomonadota bacterium]|nr:MAG: SoxR reducing system RseC family protein [Pseudomonadota bacterium]
MTSRIWQKARVTGSRAGYLTLQFASPEACRRCRQGRGCGGGLFGAWLGSSAPIVEVAAGDSVRVGDWVRVGFDTTFLVRAALRVYGLPLVAFLLGAGLAHHMLADSTWRDPAALGAALLASAVAWWLAGLACPTARPAIEHLSCEAVDTTSCRSPDPQ